jgi:hypothetical protein
LIDRYSLARKGTDRRTFTANVVRGRVVLRLSEREFEISYIDSVRVSARGQWLVPETAIPAALRAIDGDTVQIRQGEEIALAYMAPLLSGPLELTIEVTGHYVPERLSR